jgi:hypothetical protein
VNLALICCLKKRSPKLALRQPLSEKMNKVETNPVQKHFTMYGHTREIAANKSTRPIRHDVNAGAVSKNGHCEFVSLELETRTVVNTAAAAHHLNRQPQTLRAWACNEDGPIRPMRINGRLAWRVQDLRQVLGCGPFSKKSKALDGASEHLYASSCGQLPTAVKGC